MRSPEWSNWTVPLTPAKFDDKRTLSRAFGSSHGTLEFVAKSYVKS